MANEITYSNQYGHTIILVGENGIKIEFKKFEKKNLSPWYKRYVPRYLRIDSTPAIPRIIISPPKPRGATVAPRTITPPISVATPATPITTSDASTQNIVVLIPVRVRSIPGGDNRQYVERCFQQFPKSQVLIVESDNSPRLSDLGYKHIFDKSIGSFPKSRLINLGVKACPDDSTIILHDADVLIPNNYLNQVATLVANGYESGHLIRDCYFLKQAYSPAATSYDIAAARFSHRTYADMHVRIFKKAPYRFYQGISGLSVFFTKKAFCRVGGMDELYTGWGYEDVDIYERLSNYSKFSDNRVITAFHLYHPRSRDRFNENKSVYEKNKTSGQVYIDKLRKTNGF